MRKVFFFAMVILLGASFAHAKTAVKPITQDDLKDLKGEWRGERIGQLGGVAKTDLIILNDSLPLKGEVTLHFPRKAAKTWQWKGQIKDGRLIIFWAKKSRSLDLGLRKGNGKMELEGYIMDRGYRGKVCLKKVQK